MYNKFNKKIQKLLNLKCNVNTTYALQRDEPEIRDIDARQRYEPELEAKQRYDRR